MVPSVEPLSDEHEHDLTEILEEFKQNSDCRGYGRFFSTMLVVDCLFKPVTAVE